MEPRSINIIGGLGSMGSLMVRLFTRSGYTVGVSDEKNGPILWKAAADHDVVMLAVPIPSMESVLQKLGPHTRKDGVVIDIASLKHNPVELLLRHCQGEVIGSHPLFGPRTQSLQEQIVFVCPSGSSRWIGWFKTFLEEAGVRVVDIDPRRHDQLMASIQVLRHLVLLCFGRSLMQLDFDLGSDLPVSGPWFSCLVNMLKSQLEQPPALYADLAIHNPATEAVVTGFLESAQELCGLYGSGDRDTLMRVMSAVSSYVSSGDRNPAA
jgi:prephenate dehydrogenase